MPAGSSARRSLSKPFSESRFARNDRLHGCVACCAVYYRVTSRGRGTCSNRDTSVPSRSGRRGVWATHVCVTPALLRNAPTFLLTFVKPTMLGVVASSLCADLHACTRARARARSGAAADANVGRARSRTVFDGSLGTLEMQTRLLVLDRSRDKFANALGEC